MRIGILGGGQLGRMLALAGYPLGLSFRFLDPSPEACAGQVGELVVGGFLEEGALARFAEGLDLVTYEFENVPVEAAHLLAKRLPVLPPPKALEVAQDRLLEKTFMQSLGVPTPPFRGVEGLQDLREGFEALGFPALLKTRRGGYDGKSQALLTSWEEAERAFHALGGGGLILEGYVPFQRELSILGVRSRTGEVAFYPLVENRHQGGILRLSLAPAPGVSEALQRKAEDYARRALMALDYTGVLALEFFQVGEELLFNEMAPRVHNSGHWTLEGAETSQFENHLRALLGLPLGSTAPRGYSAMVNLIGLRPDFGEVLRLKGAHLHWYGKAVRPGRKVGHITLRQDRWEGLEEALPRLVALAQVPVGP
ncbi:5-(carboxyamino)imidazole ribonucleotide synthase [Thermus scotoductus]|uniref:N5-carboxyaminoimidazole ribonucleotide synthase n=1 Tax=Thermus scotoductus TaxID=37636 RepID=A0A430SD40_THESC|nr:5-(carboxyamino)imidazole ribonucleotide synthase [Thermus scotoductus]RTG97087.1 5-(carboxyamino)imidazole ribonucleotide synthase [Thermus scotoductus]RTH09556.1 5-(carboxyamino)imidazole ribonucleotide synthase [Thermus scotoductus]RTH10260.1 5-(carboxyamino)imidazole ribonucleotide synthase [Thermus scotoductus]RTH12061.1 5-(carboxyamino)imidazole ribonucleotide synthase [Thermus scotoductus]RTH19384.1 5-(carboxyamino)imidazole ribonucleotide synthase [Thermus scotoductus]